MLRFALALVLVAGSAYADKNDKDDDGKNDKYPMAGAAYRKQMDEKLAQYKERLEDHMKDKSFRTSKREKARKRLDAIAVEVHELVETVAADDTVTEAEAKRVKKRGKTMREAHLGMKREKGD